MDQQQPELAAILQDPSSVDVDGASLQLSTLLDEPKVDKLRDIWLRTLSKRKTSVLLDRLYSLGITRASAANMTFEPNLTSFLRKKCVVAAVKCVLERIHRVCNLRNKVANPNPGAPPERVNVRVFIAAYMIVSHPGKVFDDAGAPLEQALHSSAEVAIDQFENICAAIHSHPHRAYNDLPLELTAGFSENLREYFRCFRAWKGVDEVKLATRIKHAVVALHQAYSHLPPDEPVDSPLKQEFATQLIRLREKLLKVVGRDQLDEFDAFNPAPPGVPELIAAGTTNPAIVPLPRADEPGGNTRTTASGLEISQGMIPGRMSNEELAHALLIDPAFRLNDEGTGPGCDHYRAIRETFHRAFWDSLIADITARANAPVTYVRVARVLDEVRLGLCEAPGGVWPLSVDIDTIPERARVGGMAWADCVNIVRAANEAIVITQRDARRQESQALWAQVVRDFEAAEGLEAAQPAAFCRGLEYLLNRVNAIRIDLANARLTLIGPIIAEHGFDYERGKFDDKLAAGTVTLERTQAWVHGVLLYCPAIGHNNDHNNNEGHATRFCTRVITHGVLTLPFQAEPIARDNIPETLLLDLGLLKGLQKHAHFITSGATLLVMSARILGEDNTKPHATEESIAFNAAVHAQIGDVLADVDMSSEPVARQVSHTFTFYYLTHIALTHSLLFACSSPPATSSPAPSPTSSRRASSAPSTSATTRPTPSTPSCKPLTPFSYLPCSLSFTHTQVPARPQPLGADLHCGGGTGLHRRHPRPGDQAHPLHHQGIHSPLFISLSHFAFA
jgi:hypothetical protein